MSTRPGRQSHARPFDLPRSFETGEHVLVHPCNSLPHDPPSGVPRLGGSVLKNRSSPIGHFQPPVAPGWSPLGDPPSTFGPRLVPFTGRRPRRLVPPHPGSEEVLGETFCIASCRLVDGRGAGCPGSLAGGPPPRVGPPPRINYDASKEVTLQGTVTTVNISTHGPGPFVSLTFLADGTTYDVMVGPQAVLTKQSVTLAAGDALTLVGVASTGGAAPCLWPASSTRTAPWSPS